MPIVLEAITQYQLLAEIKQWLINEGAHKRTLAEGARSAARRKEEITAASALEMAGYLIGGAVIRTPTGAGVEE